MPLHALGDAEPDIHPVASVPPDAVVVGAVSPGTEAPVWPTAVPRGRRSRTELRRLGGN